MFISEIKANMCGVYQAQLNQWACRRLLWTLWTWPVLDGILESEDSRAEQQAENAIRVIEHWKSFAKRYGSRHGLLLYFRCNLCLDNLRLDTLCLQQKKQRTHRPAPGNPRGTGESKIHGDMLCRFRISEE
jgi:hypothetical protein